MSCNRGRATPDATIKQRLFADSAGYCQRPTCQQRLFIDAGSKTIHIAEIAHIIAASNVGPRGKQVASNSEKSSYSNLILLCSNCHTIIDKAPTEFPEKEILLWKEKHVDRISSIFGAIEYQDRKSARLAIESVLSENKVVFDLYGPQNEYSANPESELADVWNRKVCAIILPNNRKALAILDKNRILLSSDERMTVEVFRQHVEELEEKYIVRTRTGRLVQFPGDLAKVFSEMSNV